MLLEKDEIYSIAYSAVNRFAPEELPLFDDVWEDFKETPENQGELIDVQQGGGTEAQISLMASIIIPIVVAVASDQVKATVNAIVGHFKNRNKQKVREEVLREVATYIVQEIDQRKHKDD